MSHDFHLIPRSHAGNLLHQEYDWYKGETTKPMVAENQSQLFAGKGMVYSPGKFRGAWRCGCLFPGKFRGMCCGVIAFSPVNFGGYFVI